jgi:hypothetical protein
MQVVAVVAVLLMWLHQSQKPKKALPVSRCWLLVSQVTVTHLSQTSNL